MELRELSRTSSVYKEWRYWSRKAASIKDKESDGFKRVEAKRLELKALWMKEKGAVSKPKPVIEREVVEVKPTTFHLHYLWHPSHSLNKYSSSPQSVMRAQHAR